MTKKRVIKTISFSTKDEYEVELLDFALNHAEYFGRYVKRLIADHMARVKDEDGDLLVVSPISQSRRVQTVVDRSVPEVTSVDESVNAVKNGERVVNTVIESTTAVEDIVEEDDFSDDMMNFV